MARLSSLVPGKAAFVRLLAAFTGPRMIYGLRGADGAALPHSRLSTNTRIEGEANLVLGDHVFIGHFNFIDASGGLVLGEGVQVANFTSILSHSTHRALRVMGQRFWGASELVGGVKAATAVGPYSFVGPHGVLMPGTRLGRGSLVAAYSLVRGEHPDFAILAGNPAVVVGDTRAPDAELLAQYPEFRPAYEAWARGEGSGGAG